MPAERVAMRKIREVLRLHFACGLSKRRIAPLVGVGPSTVREYIGRATTAGVGWPLPVSRSPPCSQPTAALTWNGHHCFANALPVRRSSR